MSSKKIKNVNVKAFIIIKKKKKKKMKLKQWQNIFHIFYNANSIVQYAIQIKNGIIKNVNANVKIIIHAKKKIIVGIIAHVFVRIVSI